MFIVYRGYIIRFPHTDAKVTVNICMATKFLAVCKRILNTDEKLLFTLIIDHVYMTD